MNRVPAPLRVVLAAVGLVALLGAAALVQHWSPGPTTWQDPIDVRGGLGERIEGRDLVVEVGSVAAADVVADDRGWVGETPGAWVVVELAAAGRVGSTGAKLVAVLAADDLSFASSERPRTTTLHRRALSPGLVGTGVLVFEVPRSALEAGDARLELRAADETRLDSRLVVPLDLAAVDLEDRIELAPVVETAP